MGVLGDRNGELATLGTVGKLMFETRGRGYSVTDIRRRVKTDCTRGVMGSSCTGMN